MYNIKAKPYSFDINRGQGLQSMFIVKYFLKLRTEILAYENGHSKINEIKII